MLFAKKTSLNLRHMLVLIAVLPMVLALIAVVFVVKNQFDQLAQTQSTLVQPIFLQARKDEIQHFVKLGQHAIEQVVRSVADQEEAKKLALQMLRRMDLGEDNYFFVYDLHGKSLMHPRLPKLEGLNQWELRDQNGSPIIQRLIAQATAGGGFVDYAWHRPSTGREERKVGYVEVVPQFGWMIGTGLYLDHLKETQALVAESASSAMEKTRNQVLIIATAALFFVALGGLLLSLREHRSADEKLRVMAHKVVSSQEEERIRVSRELHDGIGQMLASTKFSLETALVQIDNSQTKVMTPLKKCLALLQSIMKDVSRISHNLRPSILDDRDLTSAMVQLAREFTERTGVDVDIKADKLSTMPQRIATALFRVTQEALFNIQKHASAKQVHIQLTVQDSNGQGSNWVLLIRDDGQGFDLETTQSQSYSGLGLINMRERVEMLGGQFKIDSSASGTSLGAKIPTEAL